MEKKLDINLLYNQYVDRLKNDILKFWIPRCEDKKFGGFLNCFDNKGEKLVSHDKYIWSQGRFVWLFSRMSVTEAKIFSESERIEFLRLASQGAEFIVKHCLIDKDDWRVIFLLERDGSPKQVSTNSPLDMSIYADAFAVIGLGMYSFASRDKKYFDFARKLYESIKARIVSGNFNTLPYPLSKKYKAHGIPMIMCNTARELYTSASVFDSDFASELKVDTNMFSCEVLDNFTDKENVIHEIIRSDNSFFPQLLGQHQNPGHTIEDVWFHLDACDLTGNIERKNRIFKIALKALENGWDNEFGGLLHFCAVNGGEPLGDNSGCEDEKMSQQLVGWSDKLWWIHSEALYTTLRCYLESGDYVFAKWYERVSDYTFKTFPNPDKAVGEWIQIRERDGRPQDKVVALPVKDPFHIARNFILIIELLGQNRHLATGTS